MFELHHVCDGENNVAFIVALKAIGLAKLGSMMPHLQNRHQPLFLISSSPGFKDS